MPAPPLLAFPMLALQADPATGTWQTGYQHGNTWTPLGVYHAPLNLTATTAQTVPATADINTYAPMPTPLAGDVEMPGGYPWTCLLVVTAYIDTTANNTEVALALNATGATTIPAGSKPEARLHVTGKQPVGVGLSAHGILTVAPGVTLVELQHAGGACTVSDLSFDILPLTVAGGPAALAYHPE